MEEKPAELPVSPQETQIQPPSFMDKLKVHKLKILAGVLGILVFAGAVFGAYKLGQRQVQPGPKLTPTPEAVATPTPDPTANWKTYTNQTYKFLIKYPEIFEVRSAGDYAVDFIDASASEEEKDFPSSIRARIFVNQGFIKDFEKIYNTSPGQEVSGEVREEYRLINVDHRKFNGHRAVEYLIETVPIPETDSTYDCVRWIAIKRDGDIIQLQDRVEKVRPRDCSGSLRMKQDNIFNLMLSTFRFLEEKEGAGEKVFCKEPKPEVCTMECIQNPPYICGSDGKSYCSECQACADPDIEWYVIQDELCKAE